MEKPQKEEPKCGIMQEKKRQPMKYEDATSSLLKQSTSSGNLGLTTRFLASLILRKFKPKNYVTGRWVLTIETDKQGNFLRAKAKWVLRGFQDKQKECLQTYSLASITPGLRKSCQMAASKSWDRFHIDLKTAFLQGQSHDVNRDVVCQLPPEAGHPPKIAARLKKPVHGMNDAPRRWWNILDKALRTHGMIPTRADRCFHVLYSIQSRERAREHRGQSSVAQQNDSKYAITKSREQSEVEAAFEKNRWIP